MIWVCWVCTPKSNWGTDVHEEGKLKNQNPNGQQRIRKATEKGKAYKMSLLDGSRKLLTKRIIKQSGEIIEITSKLNHCERTNVAI